MVIGLDEVGRGSWAGPLVFAGVLIPDDFEYLDLLKDSKKLNFKKRRFLSEKIKINSVHKIVEVDNNYIDKYGLTLASKKACEDILKLMYSPEIISVILDGSINYLRGSDYETLTKCVIKADASYPCVMAASIIAKDYRDNLMIKISKKYKRYDFENNYGYGTRKHIEALQEIGISEIHRKSFKPIQDLL